MNLQKRLQKRYLRRGCYQGLRDGLRELLRYLYDDPDKTYEDLVERAIRVDGERSKGKTTIN